MKKLIIFFLLSFFITNVLSQSIDIELFADGFEDPVDIKNAGDQRLFVVEKAGVIKILNTDGTTNNTAFLDISSHVNASAEAGLLGLDFHPNYAANGFFYVHYTDTAGNSQISRFSVDSVNPDLADSSSELYLLNVERSSFFHVGGSISFTPDGYLYIALGDDLQSSDNSQNLNTHLGKILRIDVDNPSGGNNYGIPSDNPFVGNPNALDEIWAYGLRNPYRFSIDDPTNTIWIGDVGQSLIEEVDRASLSDAGLNYGWGCYEGSHFHNNFPGCDNPAELTFPVFEYPNETGSVIGGQVYRGSNYADLENVYVFASLRGMIATIDEDLNFINHGDFNEMSWVGLGEDVNKELYIIRFRDENFIGAIYKIEGDDLSINDFNDIKISLFPNPSTGKVVIQSNQTINQIQIVDITGSLLYQESNEINIGEFNIENLSQGIYIIRFFTDEGKNIVKKLLVQ